MPCRKRWTAPRDNHLKRRKREEVEVMADVNGVVGSPAPPPPPPTEGAVRKRSGTPRVENLRRKKRTSTSGTKKKDVAVTVENGTSEEVQQSSVGEDAGGTTADGRRRYSSTPRRFDTDVSYEEDEEEEEEEEERSDDEGRSDEDAESDSAVVLGERKYLKLIKEGPTSTCTCCGKLIFPRHGRKLVVRNVQLKHGREFLEKIRQVSSSEALCSTCYKKVLKGNVPDVSIINGWKLEDPPIELRDLTNLEERMVSPRIPFMQIRTLGCDRTKFLKGHVVNVPTDIDRMVNVLPRRPRELDIVQVHLKRRVRNRGPYLVDTVRPARIRTALAYLLDSPLYVSEKIRADWAKLPPTSSDNVAENDVVAMVVVEEEDRVAAVREDVVDGADDDDYPSAEDEEVDVHTMLHNQHDPARVAEATVTFIAGEGNKPLSFILDKHVEELSFPTIYHGRPRPTTTIASSSSGRRTRKITYSDIVKFELLHHKRYCCRPDKIFFSFKLKQTMELFSGISLCVRQKRETRGGAGGRAAITAAELLDERAVADMVKTDQAYSFTRNMRSSPSFWQAEKQKLFAMIGQMGVPTFFITLSSADGKWSELLAVLGKVLYGDEYSAANIEKMRPTEKAKLIRDDPVTVVRYFDNRIRLLWTLMRQRGSTNCIFGPNYEMVHYYYRVEFQHRGAPHVHSVIYLRNAPTFDGKNEAQCCTFIDEFVAAAAVNVDVADDTMLAYQRHSHSHSCGKLARRDADQQQQQKPGRCRYGIPFYPMRRTVILAPLPSREETLADDDDHRRINVRRAQDDLMTIRDRLDARSAVSNADDAASFDEFLDNLGMSEERYLNAVRSELKKYKVFLKRDLRDVFVNPYNAKILNLHRANMDIQYIVDPYNCVSYIVNYINKSDTGLSKLMAEAQAQIRAGDLNTKEKLRRLGNVLLGSSEVSVQEAAYHTVGLRLTNCSVKHVFVNTFPPEQRVRMVKSRAQLRALGDDACQDVFVRGMLEHYVLRPDSMEDVSLARFATDYEYANFTANTTTAPADALLLRDHSGYVRKRGDATDRKILRFRRYRIQSDPNNFYRENLMLFVPWRDEARDLLLMGVDDRRAAYERHAETIRTERATFVKVEHDDFERLQEEVRREATIPDPEDDEEMEPYDAVYHAGNSASCGEQDLLLGLTGFLDEVETGGEVRAAAAATTTKTTTSNVDLGLKKPTMLDRQKLFDLTRSLNYKQSMLLGYAIEAVSRADDPFHVFVAGGAGVGKSHLIKTLELAVINQLVRRRRRRRSELLQGDERYVLVCAPTGKAAYNIDGSTLHSTLHLPVNQLVGPLVPLSDGVVNTVRCEMRHVKLIIVDEISMVGGKMLSNVSMRLQQIFANDRDFGGVSVAAFGDLRQLPPVGDCYVFRANRKNVTNYCDIVDDYLWRRFKYFELDEVMRQKEDARFAEALNNMANGSMTAADVRIFKERHVGQEFDGTLIPRQAICLLRTNKAVDRFNAERLQLYDEDVYTSEAVDSMKGSSVTDKLKRQFLNAVKRLRPGQCFGLAPTVPLHVGARYMITVNVDVSDGMVNGACGVLRALERNEDGTAVRRIWLEFEDNDGGKVGQRARLNLISSNPTSVVIKDNLAAGRVPVTKCTRQLKVKKGFSDIAVERSQFPVTPAEAMTVHKAQGATYQCVALKIEKCMPKSALYVACSRVRRSSGLYLFGDQFTPPPVISSSHASKDPVDQELKELRGDRRRQLRIPMDSMLTSSPPSCTFRLTYQNVQSYARHKGLMETDPQFNRSDIIVLVETWIKSSDVADDGELDGRYRVVSNLAIDDDHDDAARRTPYGILCLAKTNATIHVELVSTSVKPICTSATAGAPVPKMQITRLAVGKDDDDDPLAIYVVYFPPAVQKQQAIQFLDENVDFLQRRLLLLGDFNTEWNDNSSLKTFLAGKRLVSVVRCPTTWDNTAIDWCLTNDPQRTVAIIGATVYSHHKPIVVNIYHNAAAASEARSSVELSDLHAEASETVTSVAQVPPEDMPPPPPPPPPPYIVSVADRGQFVGLRNEDGVSCYANAVIRCVLSVPPLADFVLKGRTRLERLLSNIMRGSTVDTLSVRSYLGATWHATVQQDCQEFMVELMEALTPRYRDELQIVYCNTLTCRTCGVEREEDRTTALHMMLRPCLVTDDQLRYNFDDLFRNDADVNHHQHRRCEECGGNAFQSTLRLVRAGTYVVLWFINYTSPDHIHVLSALNFDEDRVRIPEGDGHANFHAFAMVHHRGETCCSGHYYADVRDRQDHQRRGRRWTRYDDERVTISDTIIEPNLRGCTLMFLERI